MAQATPLRDDSELGGDVGSTDQDVPLNCSISGTEAAVATMPTAWQPSKNWVHATLPNAPLPGVASLGGMTTFH